MYSPLNKTMMTRFSVRVLTGVLLAIIINFTVGHLSPKLLAQGALDGYTIMPLGASITAGYPIEGGYRIKLWNTAVAKNWNIHFVGSLSNGPDSLGDKNHEGHSGYRIDEIAALVDNVLATYNPQMILLHIGTNDVVENYDLINAPSRLKSLIEQIFHSIPTVRLLVAQIVPSTNQTYNDSIQKFNAAIPAIVGFEQAKGYNINFVDTNSALTQNDLFDDIHPRLSGYNKMADVWATAIQPLLPVNGTTLQQAVVAYTGGNLTGISQSFPVGIYKAFLGDLNVVGNDTINSLRVPQGLKVHVCQDEIPDFGDGGICRDYGPGDYVDLGALDNQISYLDVKPN